MANNNTLAAQLFIYPNPTSGNQVTLQLQNLKSEQSTITVTNLLGNVVFTDQVAVADSDTAYTLSFPESIPTGIYIIKVSSSSYSIASKVVLTK
jgi:hypothetical protein